MSLISFAGSLIPLQLDRKGIRESEDGERGGRGDYSRRRLVLIFPSNGGVYSREAINQGTAIIQGNMVPCLLKKWELQRGWT